MQKLSFFVVNSEGVIANAEEIAISASTLPQTQDVLAREQGNKDEASRKLLAPADEAAAGKTNFKKLILTRANA